MSNNNGRLSEADLEAVGKIVSGQGERHVISITVMNENHVKAYVGDSNLFEAVRFYDLARTEGTWRIDQVAKIETGW